jgi:hypothetical protein
MFGEKNPHPVWGGNYKKFIDYVEIIIALWMVCETKTSKK